jgi:hypothetical protein
MSDLLYFSHLIKKTRDDEKYTNVAAFYCSIEQL